MMGTDSNFVASDYNSIQPKHVCYFEPILKPILFLFVMCLLGAFIYCDHNET